MIAIVDYEAGNIFSVSHALRHLGTAFEVTSDPEKLASADKIVLPGVGAARPAMESLARKNLIPVLRQYSRPFLGICLGLQLMFERSEEENIQCLNLLPGTILKFDLSASQKVPHMGWNQLWLEPASDTRSPLLRGIEDGSWFYFVHSYYAPIGEKTTARTRYSIDFSASVGDGVRFGVQFHPELSAASGLRLLRNFVELDHD